MATNLLAPTTLSGIGKTLGLSQGGAPANPLGYVKSPTPASTISSTDPTAAYNALLAKIGALSQPTPAPTALTYDWSGANAKARSMAEAAVNPLYTQKLNDFLAGEEIKKSRANEDATTANTDLQTALQNALDASNITRGRTTQDTATSLANIGANESNFQTTDAASFNNARDALMGRVAASGLTGSGLGAQQIQGAQDDRNFNSSVKEQGFNTQKQQTQLASDRTFEDLTRSDTLAGQSTTQQKQKVSVDLSRALQDVDTETAAQRNSIEADRLGSILQQEQAYQKQLGQTWLQSLQGKVSSGTYSATASSLAGLF